jgi:hypothetical protein
MGYLSSSHNLGMCRVRGGGGEGVIGKSLFVSLSFKPKRG